MRSKTDTFVLELPLQVDAAQESALLKRLDAGRQIYNASLGEALRRLRLMRQSKAYQAARRIPRTDKRRRQETFRDLNKQFGFSEYSLGSYTAQFTPTWLNQHIDSQTAKKLASRAFGAVQQYAFGRRGRPRFKGKNQFDSLESINNIQGIRWIDEQVVWNCGRGKARKTLRLAPVIDRDDPLVQHGLSCRVKYVRLVRRKIRGRNRFYAQLVLEGRPYVAPENTPPEEGIVGLDIGPSTVAVVGDLDAFLVQFCAELDDISRSIRLLQRKIDRQRRANNPGNYNRDGTVKRGARRWHKSRRQIQTEQKLAELHRKRAAYRKSLHGHLANRVMRLGKTIKTEKLSYVAFQRMYGRSVQNRAPGMFVEMLRRKAESAGGALIEFPTRTTRLSQICHNCGSVVKKPLSQRWHKCDCGIVAQRDLYSAFLARCVEGASLNADQARVAWPELGSILRAALGDILIRDRPALPASFGLGRRRSGSPAKPGTNPAEAQDVVPGDGESLGKAGGLPGPAHVDNN